MGLYSTYVFPRLINKGMSGEVFAHYRKTMLAFARGEILEIGFGTGLNLPFYPSQVQKIYVVDPNGGMKSIARNNINKSSIKVEYANLNAGELPFSADFFDTIVSTWTLCSIDNVDKALQEVYRVLKPDGQFIFIEHGLSYEAHIQKWQSLLTPIQKIVADGCHLNRDMERLFKENHFHFRTLHKEYAKGVSKVAGYLFYGIATKSLLFPEN